MMASVWQQFLDGLQHTSLPEFIAVIAGIASVVFSKKEHILVYPVGMVSTVIYIYLSMKGHLYGEASVNLYYTAMSIYGWVLWAKRDQGTHQHSLHISYSSRREWIVQLVFFCCFYLLIYWALEWMKNVFASETIPWADALASASAYTGMWLMARKKIESWYWWILTNTASVPLYFTKGYVFTSFQFMVLLVLAVAGLNAWKKKAGYQ